MVRRKIEIEKIQDKSKRHVTFTKRRQGLFRKANELCKKCDAQVAVITFSLAGNLYAWGHPRVDSILKHYMDYSAQETDDNHQENKSPSDGKDATDHKNKRDMDLALSLSLPAEKEDTNEKFEERAASWDLAKFDGLQMDLAKFDCLQMDLAKFDGLQMDELEQLSVEIEEMQKKVVDRANQTSSAKFQLPTAKFA